MRRECRERFLRHRFQTKPLVSDRDMHHGTCVTHVMWCMSRSLTWGGRANVPGILSACATRNFMYLVRSALLIANALELRLFCINLLKCSWWCQVHWSSSQSITMVSQWCKIIVVIADRGSLKLSRWYEVAHGQTLVLLTNLVWLQFSNVQEITHCFAWDVISKQALISTAF